MVKMHLSFLLDLNTDDCDCNFVVDSSATISQPKESSSSGASLAKRLFTPKKLLGGGHSHGSSATPCSSSHKGVMDGAVLTMEGVCQAYQLIEYVGRERNLMVEGVFRKHGNLKKQQALKERLNK